MRRALEINFALWGMILCLLLGAIQPAPAQGTADSRPGGFSNAVITDCSGAVTSGGTAQDAISTAQAVGMHGFVIMNIDTTEVLWVKINGTAAASTAGSFALSAATSTVSGGSLYLPWGFSGNLSVVAATTTHKWSCFRW